ncbi:MAG: DsbE family thiol:disulfide interchange protein [Alphaproteobacteria bacterium]
MRFKYLAFIPLILFLVLAGYFFAQLKFGRDPALIPSVLIDRPAPMLALAALDLKYSAGLAESALSTQDHGLKPVKIVNFFASWCVPCKAEHPFLLSLAARDDLSMIGIAYKDKAADAVSFIDALGNPYDLIAQDPQGRAAIEWGLYGVPETYIIDGGGIIRYKYTGPLVSEETKQEFLNALEMILKQP